MTKCALVIGHMPNSPGAVNQTAGLTEFAFNDQLATDIISQVNGVEVERVYRDTYRGLPAKINALNADFIISMHCNAFNKQASGSEVLYYHSSTRSKAVADILQKKFVTALGIKDRGIKSKTSEDRGGYLLRYTNAPCVITEPFFIDNDDELNIVNQNRDALVQAYASSIIDIAAMLGNPSDASTNAPATDNDNSTDTVATDTNEEFDEEDIGF